ncbi:MAG: hypothetical protein ACR2HJ_07865 [Fimbriimonadales bacterium]
MRPLTTIILAVMLLGCSEETAKAPGSHPVQEPTGSVEPATDFREPTPVQNGVHLRLRLKKGDMLESLFSGTIAVDAVKGSPTPPAGVLQTKTIAMSFSTTVVGVLDGAYKLKVTSTPLKTESEEVQGEWRPKHQSGEITVNGSGRVLSDIEGLASGIHGIGFIRFPEAKVARGSKWSSTSVRNMPPFGDVKIDESYVYRGVAERASVSLHRVDMSGSGSLPGFKMSGRYFYRVSNGTLHSADLSQEAIVEIPGDKRGARVRMSIEVEVRAK